MNGPDRLELLLAEDQTHVTGIDFVYVYEDQVNLDVYFLRSPDTLIPPLSVPAADQIRITSTAGANGPGRVPVSELPRWEMVEDRQVLRLTTAFPGDFSLYSLTIDDPRIDPYFNSVTFSFKATCESDLDCAPQPHECPPEEEIDFPIDYQARDFWSLRRAVLDFASQRYPDWQDRLEADAGIMLAEVMSALGDELAYYQDRIGREAYLETATQRRSLRRHARLVDYDLDDGLAASTWLDITVQDGEAGVLAAGTDVWAESNLGESIYYEVGQGLADFTDAGSPAAFYPVDAARNSFTPHIWDEDDTCLPVGSTELFVAGHHPAHLDEGRWLLLKTEPELAELAARRWPVRVIRVETLEDPLLEHPDFGHQITRLVWQESQALPFELDLTVLTVRGNLVPATAGRTHTARFVVGVNPDDLELPDEVRHDVTRAVERQGPSGSPSYLFSLPDSDKTPLCWLGDTPQTAQPELRLVEVMWESGSWLTGRPWRWRRSFLGTHASQRSDTHFTLDDGAWKPVVGYQRIGREIVHYDYASGEGKTVRFGDGEFGLTPAKETIFQVVYRLGNGRQGNVAADAITHFDSDAAPFVTAVTNPLPVSNGSDPETLHEARQLAPDAFRSITYRAVRPEDYAETAERLAWVQQASGAFRWTGSWVTAFVTPDPRGAVTVSPAQRYELTNQLDRFRQAGREAHLAEPRYADIDLEITICVEPFAYRGEVKERVLGALLGRAGQQGFFAPDNFTFGAPVWRSRLEATIQRVTGVKAVEQIRIRRRGVFDWQPLTEPHYPVGDQEVIRLENDPNHPERGSLELIMEGGA